MQFPQMIVAVQRQTELRDEARIERLARTKPTTVKTDRAPRVLGLRLSLAR